MIVIIDIICIFDTKSFRVDKMFDIVDRFGFDGTKRQRIARTEKSAKHKPSPTAEQSG